MDTATRRYDDAEARTVTRDSHGRDATPKHGRFFLTAN
jgi:hypothetical protein